jgi:hypothetical protein
MKTLILALVLCLIGVDCMAMGKGFYWNDPNNPGNRDGVFGSIIEYWICYRINGNEVCNWKGSAP